MGTFDFQAFELLCQLLEVPAIRAEDPRSARDDRGGLVERELAHVLGMIQIGGEYQCGDLALRRAHREQDRAIASADHLPAPDDRGFGIGDLRGDTERQPFARACARLEREHEGRAFRGAAADLGPVGEATLIAFEVGEPDFDEMKAGIPQQRPVGIDPQILSGAGTSEDGSPGLFEFVVRQAPVRGTPQLARALVPDGKHLGRHSQLGLFRRRHSATKPRKVGERVRDQVRHLTSRQTFPP